MTRENDKIIFKEMIKMGADAEDAKVATQEWMTEVKFILGFEMSFKTYKRYLKDGKVIKWVQNGWILNTQSSVDTRKTFVVMIERFNTHYVCVVHPNM